MGLARRVQGARRRRCRGTSLTTSNAEIARNPHAPYGFRRRGGICGVGAPRRCTPTSPASRRLAYAPAALGTRYLLILGQAPSPHFSPAFYCGCGSGHVYCVALCRAPRHTVEYACGAIENLHIYTWREAPSTMPVCAASLRNLVRNAG
jgi:hypothetical protein